MEGQSQRHCLSRFVLPHGSRQAASWLIFDVMQKSQQARYPEAHGKISALLNKTPRGKFLTKERVKAALSCCTRYRLAASFVRLELAGFADSKTSDAYGAVFRVFLAFTAYEQFLVATAYTPQHGKDLSDTSYKGKALLSDLEKINSFKNLVARVKNLHDGKQGEAIKKALDGYLSNKKSISIITIAKALRNAFSHGRLASAPLNTDARENKKICDKIANHVLNLVDKELTAFMNEN